MLRVVHIALIGTMLLVAIGVAAEAELYKGYETPPYEVTEKEGAIEHRSYRPHIVAEVTVEGSRSNAVSRGFRVLADFIFGGNVESAKVAMTTPVSQAAVDDDDDSTWTVRFMMPSKYSLDSLPEPNSSAIRFLETPIEQQIVVQFSGRWTDAILKEQTGALRRYAATNEIATVGAPKFYFYDGPFTLPWNRRNEVALVVE